jgi:hypothetical protein
MRASGSLMSFENSRFNSSLFILMSISILALGEDLKYSAGKADGSLKIKTKTGQYRCISLIPRNKIV